jgi:hypothetical protein
MIQDNPPYVKVPDSGQMRNDMGEGQEQIYLNDGAVVAKTPRNLSF